MTSLPAALEFQGTEIRIVDREGTPWVTADDLGRALGYQNSRNQKASEPESDDSNPSSPCQSDTGDRAFSPAGDKVRWIFHRHKDEFTEGMTTVVPLDAGRGVRNLRIFSPRGCHLVAMFARTKRAVEFRRWVLDVLEGLAGQPLSHSQRNELLGRRLAIIREWERTRAPFLRRALLDDLEAVSLQLGRPLPPEEIARHRQALAFKDQQKENSDG